MWRARATLRDIHKKVSLVGRTTTTTYFHPIGIHPIVPVDVTRSFASRATRPFRALVRRGRAVTEQNPKQQQEQQQQRQRATPAGGKSELPPLSVNYGLPVMAALNETQFSVLQKTVTGRDRYVLSYLLRTNSIQPQTAPTLANINVAAIDPSESFVANTSPIYGGTGAGCGVPRDAAELARQDREFFVASEQPTPAVAAVVATASAALRKHSVDKQPLDEPTIENLTRDTERMMIARRRQFPDFEEQLDWFPPPPEVNTELQSIPGPNQVASDAFLRTYDPPPQGRLPSGAEASSISGAMNDEIDGDYEQQQQHKLQQQQEEEEEDDGDDLAQALNEMLDDEFMAEAIASNSLHEAEALIKGRPLFPSARNINDFSVRAVGHDLGFKKHPSVKRTLNKGGGVAGRRDEMANELDGEEFNVDDDEQFLDDYSDNELEELNLKRKKGSKSKSKKHLMMGAGNEADDEAASDDSDDDFDPNNPLGDLVDDDDELHDSETDTESEDENAPSADASDAGEYALGTPTMDDSADSMQQEFGSEDADGVSTLEAQERDRDQEHELDRFSDQENEDDDEVVSEETTERRSVSTIDMLPPESRKRLDLNDPDIRNDDDGDDDDDDEQQEYEIYLGDDNNLYSSDEEDEEELISAREAKAVAEFPMQRLDGYKAGESRQQRFFGSEVGSELPSKSIRDPDAMVPHHTIFGTTSAANGCLICSQNYVIEPMNTPLLAQFMNSSGRIIPRRATGTCAKHQRRIAKAIKRAAKMSFFSWKGGVFRITSPFLSYLPDWERELLRHEALEQQIEAPIEVEAAKNLGDVPFGPERKLSPVVQEMNTWLGLYFGGDGNRALTYLKVCGIEPMEESLRNFMTLYNIEYDEALCQRTADSLRTKARDLAREHLARRPASFSDAAAAAADTRAVDASLPEFDNRNYVRFTGDEELGDLQYKDASDRLFEQQLRAARARQQRQTAASSSTSTTTNNNNTPGAWSERLVTEYSLLAEQMLAEQARVAAELERQQQQQHREQQHS